MAVALSVLGWLAGPSTHSSSVRTGRMRLVQWLALMPPLLQGVGVLSLSWLAGMAATWLVDAGSLRQIATIFESFSQVTNVDRNPWIPLTLTVGLSPRQSFLESARALEVRGSQSNAAFDAARLAGASRSRARALSGPRQRRRMAGQVHLDLGPRGDQPLARPPFHALD